MFIFRIFHFIPKMVDITVVNIMLDSKHLEATDFQA